ncbi:uncharacterized protein RSE6_10300 [Rhynchosporium secalis]|uniref:Inositol-pentakisphosphate 2-kinase n=1 Tax=Rhynchosporium secalis TaxID=38038 RepID=A0A1E1MK31_RHYSE|nr:uncharacterized protein RSE6_10300 [Rhynchosporium secalis]
MDPTTTGINSLKLPSETTQITIPTLPSNARLEYLGEGAANIVYRISISRSPVQASTPPFTEIEEYGEGTPPPSEIEPYEGEENVQDLSVFDDKLLRVRKNLPTTLPSVEAQDQWSKLIFPLFPPSQLVHQSLISLRPQGYNHITALNASLKSAEAPSPSDKDKAPVIARPKKRHGVYLADDEYGLLVTDMSGPGVVQFKPKWLAQSISAPAGASRCRQCALRAQREALGPQQHNPGLTLARQEEFCPLNLLSEDKNINMNTAKAITWPHAEPDTVEQLENWLGGFGREMMKGLKDAQVRMGGRGVLAATPDDEFENLNLRIAMTLRDCSVFVRLTDDKGKEAGEIEAKMGDLDVKSPGKLSYWQETERSLIDGGWYTNKEAGRNWMNACSLTVCSVDLSKSEKKKDM